MTKRVWLIFGILILTSLYLSAQDNHYWWMKNGGESSAMGNAIIAGTRDNSAVFYNPGALGFIDDLSISVNATVYMIQRTRMFNAAGDGLHLNQWRYTYFPQMLSGMLPFKKLDRWRFGYTLMSRYNSYYRFNILRTAKIDVLESTPGTETFIGSYEYYNEIDEQWGGLGISYKLSENASIGFSTFASYRSQSYQQVLNSRTIPVLDSGYYLIALGDYDNIRYIHWKLIFKLGLALDFGKIKVGFTMTAPSIALYGDADVQREISLINFDRINSGLSNSDLLAIDRQTSLPMHNRSPLSLAAGIRYAGKKTSMEINVEYFFAIKPYEMIKSEARPFIYPLELIPEDIQRQFNFLSIYNYTNPVLNAGIGIKHTFNEKVDILGGFHTDFNFKGKEEMVDGYLISSTTWDLYHFTTGLNYKWKSSMFTIGVDYYFGMENNQNQIIEFYKPKDDLGLTIQSNSEAYNRIHGIVGVVGFTYFFSGNENSSLPF